MIRRFAFFMLMAAVVQPATAEKGDSIIRFGAQMVSPTGDFTEEDGFEILEIEADSGVGPFFEYEYMVGDKAGIFGNISFQNHDVDATVTEIGNGLSESATIGDVSVTPVEFGANFYVVQNDSLDFFLGPKIAYVMFGDVDLDPIILDPGDPDKIPTDDSFGFGANFGLDVPIGDKGWVFSVGAQYLQFELETDQGTNSVEVDIDPFVLRVGAGKKF